MTGAQRLAATLADLGVKYAFGLPGSQNADLFGVLESAGVRPVLANHEASAAFMANGYARASGKVALLVTIPGPGFAFALPGIAEARLDSVPLVHIVGTPDRSRGRFGHQVIDQGAVARALAKREVEVGPDGDVASAVQRAFEIATAEEPGPVVVHVHRAALQRSVSGGDEFRLPEPFGVPASAPWIEPLVARVQDARRPIIFVGGGVAPSASQLEELSHRLSAPVFSTLTGRGILPDDHPRMLAFDAERGTLPALNELLSGCDLILALGCRLGHNGTAGFGLVMPEEALVHVNSDAGALGANYAAGLLVHERVERVVTVLLDRLSPRTASTWTATDIASLKARFSDIGAPALPEPRFQGVPGESPAAFFEALRSAMPRDAVLVTDSGLHQLMARRYFDVLTPGGMMAPADFQSMGFAIPAATGASIAKPDRATVALVGDGGFLMTAMDLMCAVREGLKLVVVVMNDGHLGLIRLQQIMNDGRTTAVDLDNPDLALLADALGVGYELVDGDPEATLERALARARATIVEVRLGDSVPIRRARRRAAAKSAVRKALGPRLIDTVRRVLGRG